MIERPTVRWRQHVLTEQQEVAAGTLDPDDASAARLWPPAFTDPVDEALAVYEAEVAALRDPSDDDLFAAAKRVVVALNDIDREEGWIESGERDELCEYIDDVIARTGVDVRVLCARRGLGWDGLTSSRDW